MKFDKIWRGIDEKIFMFFFVEISVKNLEKMSTKG